MMQFSLLPEPIAGTEPLYPGPHIVTVPQPDYEAAAQVLCSGLAGCELADMTDKGQRQLRELTRRIVNAALCVK